MARTCRHSGAGFLKRTLMQMPNFPEIPPCGHRARVHVSVSLLGLDTIECSVADGVRLADATQRARNSSVSYSVVSSSLRPHGL